ncbi:MAG: DUF4097 family beta strand repeat protein [Acidobacteria bacterium]|nr:DUF4097 family beta strand repeat protein [Acidobacteriota bacterium]
MIRSALSAGLLAAVAVLQAGVELEDRMNRSVPAKAGGKLTVDAEYGSIEVLPGPGDKVEVEVSRKVEGRDRTESERILKDFDLQVTQTGNDVTVRGVFKTGWVARSQVSGRRQHCRDGRCLEYAEFLRTHHYKILTPREFNADLSTHGGSVSVGDLKGSVRGKTGGGSLQFGKVDGPVWGRTSGGSIRLEGGAGTADVRTSGGSIHIGDVSGDVEAHTSGGSIHIERASGRVTAKTSGGSIEVKESVGAIDASTSGGSVRAYLREKPKGPSKLETSGGSITVQLAPSAGVDVDASASGGRVHSEFGEPQPESRRDVLRTSINGGGPALRLHTSGGNIHIRKAGGKV